MKGKRKYAWLGGLLSNVLGGTRQYKFNDVTYIVEPRFQSFNPVILKELIEKIEVYHIEGTGKNRTQRVVIHYRFVCCLQIPDWYRKRKLPLRADKA